MSAKLREEIQNSFLKLAAEKPVDEITVKEIVSDCQINRNSFYYHYEDLPDLIEKVVMEKIFAIQNYSTESADMKTTYFFLTEAILANYDLFRNIYFSSSRALLEMKMLSLTDRIIRSYLKTNVFDQGKYQISKEDQEVIICIYRGEMVGQFTEVMNARSTEHVRKLIERIWELREGTLENILERADLRNRKHPLS